MESNYSCMCTSELEANWPWGSAQFTAKGMQIESQKPVTKQVRGNLTINGAARPRHFLADKEKLYKPWCKSWPNNVNN